MKDLYHLSGTRSIPSEYSIGGYMYSENLLSQGYPFVEAIASALPVCDTLTIADNGSTDGTRDVLQRISELAGKIKFIEFNDAAMAEPHDIGRQYQKVRKLAHGDYLLQIQANDIIPEEDVDMIRHLPNMYQTALAFTFPFFQYVNHYILTTEHRTVFTKNLDFFKVSSDGWSVGVNSRDSYNLLLRMISKPSPSTPVDIINSTLNGVRYELGTQGLSDHHKLIYLPKPFFKYYGVNRENVKEKIRKHADTGFFKEESFSVFQSNIGNDHATDDITFWNNIREFVRNSGSKDSASSRYNYLPFENVEWHPAVMRNLFSEDVYRVRSEVLDSTRQE